MHALQLILITGTLTNDLQTICRQVDVSSDEGSKDTLKKPRREEGMCLQILVLRLVKIDNEILTHIQKLEEKNAEYEQKT